MPKVFRFSVSIDRELLREFDRFVKENRFANRSEGFRSLVRENIVKKQWLKGRQVTGAITLVYQHDRRELLGKLTSVQHQFHEAIVSSQHIHLDHDRCFEIIAVKGKPERVQSLLLAFKSIKGVTHTALTAAAAEVTRR